MTRQIELKPCPFCGGKVEYNHNIDLEPDGIRCIHCRLIVRFLRVKQGKTFGDTMEQLAERWNERASA